MKQYYLKTHLIENPNVFFFYKGMEIEKVSNALNAIVGFSEEDAIYMDESTAKFICERLNKDSASLLANGYSEFKIEKITNKI